MAAPTAEKRSGRITEKTSEKKPASTDRIRLACKALEEALLSFESETSDKERRRSEQLLEIKERLRAIRSQLDDLSQ
jgi:hypothetical protein